MKIVRRLTIGFVFAALSVPALAQKVTPPAPGAPKPFTLPAVERLTLPNGMKVRLVPYGDVPKVTVRLVVQTGNIDEGPNEIWLSNFTGEMLQQGTTSRSAEQLALEPARMGGSLDINVAMNQFNIGGDVLSQYAGDMVRLVADVAQNPLFPESEVARLRGDLSRNLALAKSQPRQIATERFNRVMYGEHAYGRTFPTEAMISSYSAAQARQFWDRSSGAQRAAIYVVGRFDAAAVKQAVQSAFGGWKSGAAPTAVNVSPVTQRRIHLVDRPGAVQSTLFIGLPVATPANDDYVPLLVTNALLGGYFSSRITANIRESKGYTYSPGSSIAARLGSSYYLQVADVTTNVTGPSLKEIFHEIDRMRTETPTAAEVASVKSYLAGTFVLQNSSRGGIIGQLAFLDLHGLSDEYLRTYVQRIHAMTPQEFQRIAQTYLDPQRMAIVVVGDRGQIIEQLGPYGTVVEN